jgi:hypothetical protein
MQYRTGNIKNAEQAIILLIRSSTPINPIRTELKKNEPRIRTISPIPLFLDLEPLECINSIFSLSKVIEALRLTINTMAKVVTNAIMLLAGCIFKNEARLYPPLIPRKNKTLNKLSLFNLALMKLRIVASFCVLHKYTLSPIVAKKQLYIQYFRQYYFLYSINIVNMLYLRYYIRMSILSGTKL